MSFQALLYFLDFTDFKCDICNKLFKDGKTLNKHIKGHTLYCSWYLM